MASRTYLTQIAEHLRQAYARAANYISLPETRRNIIRAEMIAFASIGIARFLFGAVENAAAHAGNMTLDGVVDFFGNNLAHLRPEDIHVSATCPNEIINGTPTDTIGEQMPSHITHDLANPAHWQIETHHPTVPHQHCDSVLVYVDGPGYKGSHVIDVTQLQGTSAANPVVINTDPPAPTITNSVSLDDSSPVWVYGSLGDVAVAGGAAAVVAHEAKKAKKRRLRKMILHSKL
ncbi:MAG: hypothetical protein HY438_04370 [DPANN group archaeon]|nr:hypothetical protein [DPANN group archaeon]